MVSSAPPQLEKNHVVPPSWQDEALARHGVSREVPCSTLKGETVPDSLLRPPKVPHHAGVPRGLRDRGFFKGWESDRNDRVGLVYNSSLNQPSKGIRRRDSPTTEPLLPVCCPNPWHNRDSMQCGLQMQQDIMPLPHSVGHGPQLNCNVCL